jgi:hypothetical protein
MPLSSIAQIFIRLYALKLLVGALASFGGMLTMVDSSSYSGWSLFLGFLPNLIVIASGGVLWMISPWLSRLLTKGDNKELTLGGLTSKDLFTAVLLGLGVYFIMDSFSNVLGWFHYFAMNRSEGGFHKHNGPSYYDLSERLLTLSAGIVLTLTCRTSANRLTIEPKSEQDGGGDGE